MAKKNEDVIFVRAQLCFESEAEAHECYSGILNSSDYQVEETNVDSVIITGIEESDARMYHRIFSNDGAKNVSLALWDFSEEEWIDIDDVDKRRQA